MLARATEFTFLPDGMKSGDNDQEHFAVKVKFRAPGMFAVTNMGDCWNGSEWVHERMPSGRSEEFIAQTRMPLIDALRIASEVVNGIEVNGSTFAGWQARWASSAT